jgi:hypothetical protein
LTQSAPFKELVPEAPKVISQRPEEFEAIRYWRLSHGSIPFVKDPREGSYRFSGGLGWRGGYIPYTNLRKFDYVYLRARSVTGERNSFFIEFKYEDDQLMTSKVPVPLSAGQDWSIFEIKIPKDSGQTFNYLAVSDAEGAFEVSSVLLTKTPLEDAGLNINRITKHSRAIRPY